MLSKILRRIDLRSALTRGPKKKGGGAKKDEGPLSEDIVNIWKERKDPEIKEDEREYPLWLIQMCSGSGTIDGKMRAWATADPTNYPSTQDIISIKNQTSKFKMKMISALRKEMKSTIEQEDQLDDYRGENKLSRHVDEEEKQRMLEEQALIDQLEDDDDDEGLSKKDRFAKAQAQAEAQERLASLQGTAPPKK